MDLNLPFVDVAKLVANLASLVVAYVLALPVAWEREQNDRSAGLRTFPLVALASCGYILIASKVLGENPEAQARVLEGLMTGMGFIGGGAILKGGAVPSPGRRRRRASGIRERSTRRWRSAATRSRWS